MEHVDGARLKRRRLVIGAAALFFEQARTFRATPIRAG